MKRTVFAAGTALAGLLLASTTAWGGGGGIGPYQPSPFQPGFGNCTAASAPGDGVNVDLAYTLFSPDCHNFTGTKAEDASGQGVFSDVGEGVERADEMDPPGNDFYNVPTPSLP